MWVGKSKLLASFTVIFHSDHKKLWSGEEGLGTIRNFLGDTLEGAWMPHDAVGKEEENPLLNIAQITYVEMPLSQISYLGLDPAMV